MLLDPNVNESPPVKRVCDSEDETAQVSNLVSTPAPERCMRLALMNLAAVPQ